MMKYLLIRLAILAAIVVVCWFSINSVIRKTLIHAWYANTGLELGVGKVKSSWDPTVVELHDLRIVMPDDPTAILGTVDSITVQMNRAELLRRRFWVTNTRIHQVGLNLSPQNQVGDDISQAWNSLNDRFTNWTNGLDALPLKELLAGNLDEAAKEYAGQFEIAKFAAGLDQRWNRETESFKNQAQSLKSRLERVKQLAGLANHTADQLQTVVGVLQELDAIDRELALLGEEAQKLEPMLKADRAALDNAVKIDTQKIRSMQGSMAAPKIDANLLSKYILGEEMRDRLNGLLAWLDWGRGYVPEKDVTWLDQLRFFSVDRNPGTNVMFPGMTAKTEVHFDQIVIDGQLDFMQKPIFFAGGLRDFSNQPKRLSKPIVLRFCVSGRAISEDALEDSLQFLRDVAPEHLIDREKEWMNNIMAVFPKPTTTVSSRSLDFFRIPENVGRSGQPPLEIEIPTLYITAVLDRTGDVRDDRFLVYCPDYRLPERLLGNPENLAFHISPGVSQLLAELRLEGDNLSGYLALKQSPIQIQAALPPAIRDLPIERVLAVAVSGLQTMTADITLSGTRQSPTYAFRSNLGDRLTAQMEPVLMQEWGLIHQKAMTLLNQETRLSAEKIDYYITQKFQPLLDDVSNGRMQLENSLQQSGVNLNQLIQSQMSRLSPKDQQAANAVLNNPLFQSLILGNSPSANTTRNIGTAIDQKAGELLDKHVKPEIQESIKNILGGFGTKNSSEQTPRTIPLYVGGE